MIDSPMQEASSGSSRIPRTLDGPPNRPHQGTPPGAARRSGWRGAVSASVMDSTIKSSKTSGISVGDRLLKQVAGRLREVAGRRHGRSASAGRVLLLLPQYTRGSAGITQEWSGWRSRFTSTATRSTGHEIGSRSSRTMRTRRDPPKNARRASIERRRWPNAYQIWDPAAKATAARGSRPVPPAPRLERARWRLISPRGDGHRAKVGPDLLPGGTRAGHVLPREFVPVAEEAASCILGEGVLRMLARPQRDAERGLPLRSK